MPVQPVPVAPLDRGEPPEVEPGHFAWFYQHYTRVTGACTGADGSPVEQREFIACAAAFGHAYRTGDRQDPAVDTFFAHDRAMRTRTAAAAATGSCDA